MKLRPLSFRMSAFVLSCVKSQIADKGNILYYYDSLNSFVGMGGTMRHYESSSQVQNDKEYLKRVAATVYGSWDYTQDTELYNYYLSLGSLSAHHTRDALAVRGIQVPLNTLSTSDATESTERHPQALTCTVGTCRLRKSASPYHVTCRHDRSDSQGNNGSVRQRITREILYRFLLSSVSRFMVITSLFSRMGQP